MVSVKFWRENNWPSNWELWNFLAPLKSLMGSKSKSFKNYKSIIFGQLKWKMDDTTRKSTLFKIGNMMVVSLGDLTGETPFCILPVSFPFGEFLFFWDSFGFLRGSVSVLLVEVTHLFLLSHLCISYSFWNF